MKYKTYQELKEIIERKKTEVEEIEKHYSPIIKRYWELKDEITKLNNYKNRAMIKEGIKEP